MNWQILGRLLITAGVIIVFLGVMFLLADRFLVARLPGDFAIGRTGSKFIIPFGTIGIVSITITMIVNYFAK